MVDRGSIIQCVVFPENLPDPALFGLHPETVRIEVWNAFTEAPAPGQTHTLGRQESDALLAALMAVPDLVDTTLDFGEMRMVPGKAFPLSAANGNIKPGAEIPGSIPVAKQWLETGQGNWLIESVEYADAQPKLAALRPSSVAVDAATARQFVEEDRALPIVEPAQPVHLPMRIVNEPAGEDGFCIDYSLVYSTYYWTFQSGVTYLIDGNVWIDTSTAFETNTVVKYRRDAALTLSGTITTPSTGPPAILTSFDDYTAGEMLPGGTPVGYYAATALHLYNVSGQYGANAVLENLDIRHARTAIDDYSSGRTHIIRNCRWYVCQTGLNAYYTTVTLSNLVACAVPTLHTNSGSATITTSAISTDCQRTVEIAGSGLYGPLNVPEGLTNVIAVAGGLAHSAWASQETEHRFTSIAPQSGGSFWALDSIEFSTTVVPEPGTWALLGVGGVCCWLFVRRRKP